MSVYRHIYYDMSVRRSSHMFPNCPETSQLHCGSLVTYDINSLATTTNDPSAFNVCVWLETF